MTYCHHANLSSITDCEKNIASDACSTISEGFFFLFSTFDISGPRSFCISFGKCCYSRKSAMGFGRLFGRLVAPAAACANCASAAPEPAPHSVQSSARGESLFQISFLIRARSARRAVAHLVCTRRRLQRIPTTYWKCDHGNL